MIQVCYIYRALCESESHLVLCDFLRHHGLQPARLLCPWNSPGQNTEVGSHSLLQRIFPTQESNPGLPHRSQILYHPSNQESLIAHFISIFIISAPLQIIRHQIPEDPCHKAQQKKNLELNPNDSNSRPMCLLINYHSVEVLLMASHLNGASSCWTFQYQVRLGVKGT